MRVIAFDPGLERIGWSVVQKEGSRLTAVKYGLIQTPRIGLCDRLTLIYDEVCSLITEWGPEQAAIEKLYFAKNQTTAMDVARASGVILLACGQKGLSPLELSPPEVKLAVVGHGGAEKKQVQFMVRRLLALTEDVKPDDVADALAIAIACLLKGHVGLATAK